MDEQKRFGDDRSEVLWVITTEHFTLQTARSTATSEITSRAAMFLTTVSIALVALAFIGQTAGLHDAFTAFALVTLVTLLFLGIVTFDRTLQASIDDIATTLRINRLRELYVEMFPGLRDYIPTTVPSGGVASHIHGDIHRNVLRPSQWQLLLSVSGMVSVINGLIAALLTAVITERILTADRPITVAAATLVFLATVSLHQRLHVLRKRPYLTSTLH